MVFFILFKTLPLGQGEQGNPDLYACPPRRMEHCATVLRTFDTPGGNISLAFRLVAWRATRTARFGRSSVCVRISVSPSPPVNQPVSGEKSPSATRGGGIPAPIIL